MHLTRIDILKYKSIKNPVSVYFNEGKVVTLIGKNGSGKTNVLEAIKYAMSKNHFYGRDKIECEIKFHIELTDDEINDYFSCVESNTVSNEITIEFNGDNPDLRLIEAPIIEIEAGIFKERLDSVLENYKKATSKYLKALKEIESSDSYFGGYLDLQVVEENHGSIVRLMNSYIEQIERSVTNQVKEIKDYVQQLFKGNRISLNQYEHSYPFSQRFWSIPFYRIPEDEKIRISPIVAQSFNINKKALDKANEKLNNKLKEINNILDNEYREIQGQLDEFDKIKQEISNIFDVKRDEEYDREEQILNQFKSIVQKIRQAVFRNSYYIDNENSLIFYNSTNYNHRNEYINQEYLNSKNPIVEAFDIFLREKDIIEEKTSVIQKDQLKESQIRKALGALNSEFLFNLIPGFESDEKIRFEVKYDNGSLNLFVHEKNGEIVPFNNTSLGRRWYLTYQFVKALLKPGDMLLIDEPAAFLHPQAQTEFKNELETLAHKGICVFYSTHSPYMIPEDWGQVYNVKMTESGTKIDRFNSGDGLINVIKNDLGVTNTENILFNLSKTIILVEGVADKACIEKFACLLHKDLRNYYIHICDGDSIVQMSYLCIKNEIKFLSIADNDNRFKDKKYKLSHPNFNKCLNEMLKNDDKCFFIGEGETGCLEDYFAEENNKFHYFEQKQNKWKIARGLIKKIESLDELQQKTINNFEQLFRQLGIPKLDDIKS